MRKLLIITMLASVLLAACSTVLPTSPPPSDTVAPPTAPTTMAVASPVATAAPAVSTDAPVAATVSPSRTPAATSTGAPTDRPAVTTEPVASPEPTAPATQAPEEIACTPGSLTPGQTEGPYYTADPPEDATLAEPSSPGTHLTLTGYVLDGTCKPVPGARVDFWQADDAGQYDNSGYAFRGYQLTGADGRYALQTVVPGLYPGRTRHIHVKVTPPNGPELTTQLYFPDEPANAGDGIFAGRNLVTITSAASEAETATFNFVVEGG